MKPTTLGPLLAVILLAVVVVTQSAYIVDEREQVIILQFGEPIGVAVTTPGLKFRTPFIQQVKRFPKWLLEWDGEPARMPTKDKKYLWIDTTARWKIVDPLKFLKAAGSEAGAQTRLDDILDGAARSAVANHNLINIVRSSNKILTAKQSDDVEVADVLPEIDQGRTEILEQIVGSSKSAVQGFGIELVDIRIKRINYESEVRGKVFERMISERNRVAQKLRSEGRGKSAEVQGEKDKILKQIESEAYRQSQILRGEADAKAVKIYADSYSKDPEFYAFYKTLESYTNSLSEKDTLVLTTDNEYLTYLRKSS